MTTWATAEARAQDEGAPPSAPARRGKGHPKLSERVNWALAHKLYLHGGTRGRDGRTVHLSLEAIGERVGCTKQAVAHRAKREGWAEQREKIEQAERATLVRDALHSGSRPTQTPGQVLDAYLKLFEDAVREGRVRIDSLPDFERAITLKRRLEAEDKAATERAGMVTLDQLRDRHRGVAAQEAGYTDAACGVLAHGEPDAEGGLEGSANLSDGVPETPLEEALAGAGEAAATVRKRQQSTPQEPKASGKGRAK